VTQPVLVVEDDEDIRGFLAIVLEEAGYAVTSAANGAEALQRVAQESPDVILLDMKMPVMDGWEFAQHYRAYTAMQAPIIVMTAARDARLRAREVDAVEVLSKPFNIEELLTTVERALRRPGV
jgi:DNA-binding response OmpR family regulator